MSPAWRGVVVDGAVWAWPMVLMDHSTAFQMFPRLSNYTCRWRQWEPRPCPGGGVYLCDDEGNREWFPSYAAAKARAGNKLIEG